MPPKKRTSAEQRKKKELREEYRHLSNAEFEKFYSKYKKEARRPGESQYDYLRRKLGGPEEDPSAQGWGSWGSSGSAGAGASASGNYGSRPTGGLDRNAPWPSEQGAEITAAYPWDSELPEAYEVVGTEKKARKAEPTQQQQRRNVRAKK